MTVVLLRRIAAILFLLASLLYGGFWLTVAIVDAKPDSLLERRLNLASSGLAYVACGVVVAALVLVDAKAPNNRRKRA